MKLTALEVRTQHFQQRMRGYDPFQVKAFLEQVSERLEHLTRENLTLQENVADARARAEELRAREHQVREVLVTAQKAGEDVMAAAEREGEARIAEAKAAAERIVARARKTRLSMLQEVEELRRQRERFTAELRAVIGAHFQVLDNLEADRPPERFDIDDADGEEGDHIPVVCELGAVPISRAKRKKAGQRSPRSA